LEEQMNRILLAEPHPNQERTRCRLATLGETAARRERYRKQILHRHKDEIAPQPADPIKQLEARDTIRQVIAQLNDRQWEMLIAHSRGFGYPYIAEIHNVGIAAARTQIHRLRRQLAYLNPAA
jgi:DNA-directed RNA polymerase specialized sigma24 family protein